MEKLTRLLKNLPLEEYRYIKLLRSLTKLFRIKISEGEHRAKVSHYNNAR